MHQILGFRGQLISKCPKYQRNFLRISALASKAQLLQEGIFLLIHLFDRDVLAMKKLEIKKTKPTFIISVLKVEY